VSTGIFRIELLPAAHGDCILVSYGRADSPRFVLIDTGPINTYPEVRARLRELELPRVELLVLSHVDADHIEGAIKLLNDADLGLAFGESWFNGWPQLSQPIQEDVPLVGSAPPTRGPLQGEYVGVRLTDSATAWNSRFGGCAVVVPDVGALPKVMLPDGLTLTLLSPSAEKLVALRAAWSKAAAARGFEAGNVDELRHKLGGDKRYRGGRQTSTVEVLDKQVQAAVENQLDDAVANGSSIAFIAEFGEKRCAFLADAHMPVIERSLARLAEECGEERLRLDAVKVSHHGSRGNTTSSFLDRIECDTFLVSTDGSHFGHPDDEAIERILARGAAETRLVFNYRSKRNAKWASEALQRERRYTAVYPQSKAGGIAVDLMGQKSPVRSAQ
jgi:beta-lactamase superfamily II metal-dependent hydrolase